MEYVNNHIHTTYSFSPYTPEQAVFKAREAGLRTAGIMDHDSVAGAWEFINAGKRAGVATTVGIEIRCSIAGTPFEGRKLNNTDQASVAYLTMHGIPHGSISLVQDYMAPYRAARAARGRKMTERLDGIFAPFGVRLDFDRDVEPISRFAAGGTITERHVLFALASKLIERFGAGGGPPDFLVEKFGIHVPKGIREKLAAPGAQYYQYHLLGLLKGNFMEKFYIDAGEELIHASDFLRLSEEAGAISAYPYLGDVADSVTGDKKDSKYEDAFLDELVAWAASVGFRALTYMPARNTRAQLERVIALCERHGLFQISGEDINTPFQNFICPALAEPCFAHLVSATWALIGHEKAASENPERGMFTRQTMAKDPDLYERIAIYEKIGRAN